MWQNCIFYRTSDMDALSAFENDIILVFFEFYKLKKNNKITKYFLKLLINFF